MLLLWGAVGCLLFFGCTRSRIGEPPRAPRANEPTDLIPADLDLVARLDLAQMRRSVAAPEIETLTNSFQERVKDEPGQRLLEQALRRADTVWVALRPRPVWAETDNVLVLRGDFEDFDPRPTQSVPAFRGPTDLGGGWRYYERDPSASRAAPVRIYARHQDLVAFVSNAEIDSTERTLRGFGGPRALPPAKGAVSLVVRADVVARWVGARLPWVADLLAGATEVMAYADLRLAGLEAEVHVGYRTGPDAEAARFGATQWVRLLAKENGLVGRIARALKTELVGDNLVMRVTLGQEDISHDGSDRSSGAKSGGDGPIDHLKPLGPKP
jgi:hypothetical protein